ncbi:MAG: protein translocase subunit SecF [Rickettsiales bacterium]|jgi:preprotein translocase SecF subunit|nr:protein translocase subunit SecF [Rickettsiales bacterium]
MVYDDDYLHFMKLKVGTFVLSAIFVILTIFFLFKNGLSFGIDFTGGILFDITAKAKIEDIRENLTENKIGDFSVQGYGESGFIIRIAQTQQDTSYTNRVKSILDTFFKDEITYNKIDFVGPQVGKELIKNGIIAFILSLVAISFYIWFRFEWNFAVGVIITLIHDILILFGIYSFFRIDFDLTSVAAILTVMGYSMNDTVVIYDRLREFIPKYKNKSLTEIIDRSLTTTLRRTLLTSSTTLISLLILGFYGGDSIKFFSLIVFIGIIIGTYSSFFISAPVLLYINGQDKK